MDLRDVADMALTERVPNGCAGPTRTVEGSRARVLVVGKIAMQSRRTHTLLKDPSADRCLQPQSAAAFLA